jgi:TolB-like protein
MRFWAQVIGWTFQSAWALFNRFPKWVRVLAAVWVGIALVSRGCSSDERPARISATPATNIADGAVGHDEDSLVNADVTKLGAQIAREVTARTAPKPALPNSLLAIPFAAPSGDPAAKRLADSTFAQMYGSVAISHHGNLDLMNEPLSSLEPSAAAARGREHHSNYVLFGAVDSHSAPPSLVVKIVAAADGSVLWSQAYPSAGADPAKIAADVTAKVQSLPVH